MEEGGAYDGPVTIEILVEGGSYTARLNGEAFTSGHTVSEPGSYVLVIEARNGEATTSKTIHFSIAFGSGGVTVVRLIDLGPNDSGGGGDAILITDTTAGVVHSALIDAGPAGANSSDPGFVARHLKELGIDTLDFVMLTHAHGDHYLGMNSVLTGEEIGRFIYNGQVRSLASYESVVSTARGRVGADSVIVPNALMTFGLGPDSALSLTVVPPLPTWLLTDTDDGTELNEGSLGMRLRRGSFEMFFTGDGEVQATRRWRTTFSDLTADVEVLKVGHHGANNAIFDNGFNGVSSWLDHTSPEVSVISANGTTHPRINALTALLSRSSMRTYCTNVHGDISIRIVAEGSYSVMVERNAEMDCVAGSEATT